MAEPALPAPFAATMDSAPALAPGSEHSAPGSEHAGPKPAHADPASGHSDAASAHAEPASDASPSARDDAAVGAAPRALMALAVLVPCAYAVTTFAWARISGEALDWSSELPRLALLTVCSAILLRTSRGALQREQVDRETRDEALALADALALENARLSAALDDSRATARDRSDVLTRMGHHLRTPMNGILATTELALAGELSPEQRDLLSTARDSGRALLRAVDHVLDAARIEAGELALRREPVDVQDAVRRALTHHAAAAADAQCELACRVSRDAPALVLADSERLVQVLDHVLGLALAAAGRGTVVLAVERADDQLRLVVSHSGAGPGTDGRSPLSSPWDQGDERDESALGPAVAAQLVTLMGGRLTIDHEVGVSGRFVVQLPLLPELESSAHEAPALSGLSVLVADERMTSRAIVADSLRAWGARVVAVELGREALDALEEAVAVGRPHHAVILSADLPDRDVFAQDFQRLFADAPCKLLVVGGEAGPGQLQRPVLPRDLAAALGRGGDLPVPGALTAPDPAPAPGRERPLRVLVVEDNPVGQKVAQRLLSAWGHTVWVAGDGQRALEMLERHPVDVVFMDIAMPVLDGLSATRELRAREAAGGDARMPVIAMTAHTDRGDRERCLAAGMDSHLAKPIRAEEMAAVLAELRAGDLLV